MPNESGGNVQSRARALVIGIDDYPFIRANPLEGCRNDARRMAALLADVFGFTARLLLDHEATRDRILAALDELAEAVRPGDRVVLHFSGHGSRIERPGEAPIETLLPQDSGRGAHPNRDISDREIDQWVQQISATTPFLTLIFDSCHAGGIVRDLEATARGVAPDRRSIPAPAESVRPALRSARATGPSGWLPRSDRYTLIAACKATERAREMEDPLTGQKHGALTHYLTETLANGSSTCSYRDVFERVSASLVSRFREQNPQLEGAWDRQIFDQDHLPSMRFAPVRARSGGRVTLAAGIAHGLREGSVCLVYPAGTRRSNQAEALGRIRLDRVSLLAAEGSLTEETSPGSVDAGARAVEVTRPLGVGRLKICILGNGRNVDSLRRIMDRAPLFEVCEHPQQADFTVTRLEARSSEPAPGFAGTPPSRPVLQLGALGRATWATIDGSGRQVMPPRLASSPSALEQIRGDLETWARYRTILALEAQDADPALRRTLEIELLRRAPGAAWRPAAGKAGDDPCFHAGDDLGIRIRHQHPEPLFITVLDLGLTGCTHMLHPVRGAAHPIATGQILEVGIADDDRIRLSIPDVLPYPGETYDEGIETLVILATTDDADSSMLAQDGIRGLLGASQRNAGPSSSSPATTAARGALRAVLQDMLIGKTLRDARKIGGRPPAVRWTLERKSFRLRRCDQLNAEH